jgi:RimJ/RimL family protein N-acetyltransferase
MRVKVMNIEPSVVFEKIDPNNLEQARVFVSWYENPIMINNWVLQKEEKQEVNYTISDFQKQYTVSKGDPEKYAFMVKADERYIGYGQFYINHQVCLIKNQRVCWPSIAIGEDNYRSKGFGLSVCKEILRMAKEFDCTHIEAGIFEFNEKMKQLLVQNKFELIGKQEKKTFVDGRWWSSEHYAFEL